MITLLFTNGMAYRTKCKTPAAAIRKALEVSPVKGSIKGTKLIDKNEIVFGEIVDSCSWIAIDSYQWGGLVA